MSWWNSSWSYRKKLTFDNSGQSQNLSNFPVLVKLTNANFDFNKAQDNGEDIRFVDSDDTTQLKYEIENWDKTNEKAWIWVKVPQIDGSSSTDYIYMYYGNSEASDSQDAQNVWDSNYKAVWHLNKSSGSVLDSTINNNDGTNNGATRGQTGQVDRAFSFDGTDDYVSVPHDASIEFADEDFTLELWIKADENDFGAQDTLFCKGSTGAPGSGKRYEAYAHPGEDYLLFAIDDDVTKSTVTYNDLTNWADNTWHYLVFRRNTTTNKIEICLDGSEVGEDTDSTGDISSGETLYIGCGFSTSSRSNYTDAIIDEFRISDQARSADWIKAQYLSMTGAFTSFAAEETETVTKTSSDTGAGVEDLLSRAYILPETGTGSEALGSRLLGVAEEGGGNEALLTRLLASAQTASGLDFGSLFFASSDVGLGLDAILAVGAILTDTDSGSGTDISYLVKVLLSTESGLGTDTVAALIASIISSELMVGSDRLVVKVESAPKGGGMRLPPGGKTSIPSRRVNL